MQKDKNKQHRKKIIIASVLKPISDPRMFEKFGMSLAKSDQYLIFLAGYTGKYINIFPNIRFKQLYNFGRLSLQRLLAPFSFFLYVFKVNPRVIIIQTHELLWPSCFYKLIFGTKIIYDLQENYYRNIRYSNKYFLIFSLPLALYIRLKEKITSRFIDHFILAEKCYLNELSFIGHSKSTVIENKYQQVITEDEPFENIVPTKKRLIFTGTIARSTGVFDAIRLAKKMHEADPEFYLVIVGQCSISKELNELKKIANKHRFIKLKCKSTPVHHEDILKEIRESKFGIISYPVTKVTSEKFPTKLYEYLANDLPVICCNNPLWKELIEKHHGGIMIDFKNIDAGEIIKKIGETQFFDNQFSKADLFWESEEAKLVAIVDGLFN